MQVRRRLAALPLSTALTLAAHAQPAPTIADEAAAARANALRNQQVQQQRDAGQREATVQAPVVRSTVPTDGAFPALPDEQPCFRVDTFALTVPATLPNAIRE